MKNFFFLPLLLTIIAAVTAQAQPTTTPEEMQRIQRDPANSGAALIKLCQTTQAGLENLPIARQKWYDMEPSSDPCLQRLQQGGSCIPSKLTVEQVIQTLLSGAAKSPALLNENYSRLLSSIFICMQ